MAYQPDLVSSDPGISDPMLGIPAGNYSGYSVVNKFGRSTNVDSGVATDIHDGANADSYPTAALDDRDTWQAPTQARTHQIKSTDVNDDGDPVGTGARTIQIYGLTAWTDTSETSETITLNGTTNVATSNSYVIIHRMKVLTAGSSGPNVGTIYATADTDSTITAQINPAEGQTQMAVYGIGAYDAYMVQYYMSAVKGAASVGIETTLLVNNEPDSQLTSFLVKHTLGLATEGTSKYTHKFEPYFKITGPAIIKLRANASANNTDVSGGFDLILVDR